MDLIENAKDALEKYYNLIAYIDRFPVADALDKMSAVADGLADALADFVYNE